MLRRFFNSPLLVIAVSVSLLLQSCAGGGGSLKSRERGMRAPVAISASLQEEFKKALSLLKKSDYEQAIPLLEAIVASNSQLPGAQINLAIAYMHMGETEDFEKAENALVTAVETNPEDEVAYNQLGLLYRKTGRFDQARQAYAKAIRLNSNYAMAYLNMGILCDIYVRDFKCAIDHFEKYALLAPEQAEQVGLWLSDLRQRTGAVEPGLQEAEVL